LDAGLDAGLADARDAGLAALEAGLETGLAEELGLALEAGLA
jgi:hypothetical protein